MPQKIYNKLVIDIESGIILEEDSYVHDGPVAEMKGGSTTVQAPQPSAEEIELQKQNLEITKQMWAEQQMFTPVLLQQMGYKNVDGKLVPLSDEERMAAMTTDERSAYDRQKEIDAMNYEYLMSQKELMPLSSEVQKLQLARQKAAYEGTLPVDPAIENDLAEQKYKLTNYLEQRLGPNWATSTPGIQAMAQYEKQAELIRSATRRDEMQSGSANYQSYLDRLTGSIAAPTDYYSKMQENVGNIMAYPTRSSGVSSSTLASMNPYIAQRQAQLQASIANAQAKSQSRSGFWGGMGSMMGSGLLALGMKG